MNRAFKSAVGNTEANQHTLNKNPKRREDKTRNRIFQEITAENFPKDINLHIQQA